MIELFNLITDWTVRLLIGSGSLTIIFASYFQWKMKRQQAHPFPERKLGRLNITFVNIHASFSNFNGNDDFLNEYIDEHWKLFSYIYKLTEVLFGLLAIELILLMIVGSNES